MTRIAAALVVACLASTLLLAQEDTTPKPAETAPAAKPAGGSSDTHFEVEVETGLPSVLSGPEIDNLNNVVVRIGWNPKKSFTIMGSYIKMTGQFTKDNVLNQRFSEIYNRDHSPSLNFRDAFFDDRDVDIQQYMLGIAKFIPISKRWETFVGVSVGVSSASTDVTWSGATHQDGSPAVAALSRDDSNAFLTNVRGGLRFSVIKNLALQASFDITPIGSLFEEDNSYFSLNLGVVGRF